jgi:hypothetical protein
MTEAREYDKRVADAWKDDSTGVLVFVSPDLSVPAFTTNDKLEDRSLLRNRRGLHH